jgi:hypothetical protein
VILNESSSKEEDNMNEGSGGKQPCTPGFLAEYASEAALERLFVPDVGMSDVVAYVLVQRVQQLSRELAECREREKNAAASAASLTRLREELGAELERAVRRADTADEQVAIRASSLQSALREIDRLTEASGCQSRKLRDALGEVVKLSARASKAENLNRRNVMFLDDVGVQIGNYGIVDLDAFRMGRLYAATAGAEGAAFAPDGIPATDRAERAHKRRLIRRLAEQAGIKLGRRVAKG